MYLCDISQSQAVIVNLTRLTTLESPGGFFSTEATDVQFLGGFVDSHQFVVIFLYTMFLRFLRQVFPFQNKPKIQHSSFNISGICLKRKTYHMTELQKTDLHIYRTYRMVISCLISK